MSKKIKRCNVCGNILTFFQKKYNWNKSKLCSMACLREFMDWAQEYKI